MSNVTVKVKKLYSFSRVPVQSRPGDAGFDLSAIEGLVLHPGERVNVGTGIAIEVPEGYEAQIRPRSGLANDYGITVLNSPGTVDSNFRGEVRVILCNKGYAPYTVRAGERIAQIVIAAVPVVDLVQVEALSPSERGEQGFGSSGKL